MSHVPPSKTACPDHQTQQAQQFLKQMQQMSPGAEHVFRDIYAQAPHQNTPDKNNSSGNAHRPHKGHHVRQAMMAALIHPEIAYWSRMNLAVRVARKLAQTTGQHHTVARLEQTLEAFHRAADAFVLKQSIAEPHTPVIQRIPPTMGARESSLHPPKTAGAGLPPEEISRIEQFKAHIIPGLVQRIRAGRFA